MIHDTYDENKRKYTCYRNRFTTIIRLSRRTYCVNEFENYMVNMSSTWKVINEAVRKQKNTLKMSD